MILRHLQLKNFLSHRQEEISFPAQGMFLLSGESGAGKSSLIIDATAYALFGAAAVTRAKRQSELVSDGQDGAQEMKVKAVFDLDGQALVVERGIAENGQPWARVYAGDGQSSQLLAEGPKAVSRALTTRLGGMTWQQFFAAFVARQDEISSLTSLRGAERKNLIHRMLGMRELEKSAEIIANRRRRVRAERQQLELSLGNFDPQAAEEELAELQSTVSDDQQRLATMKKDLEEKERQLSVAEQQRQGLQQQAAAGARRQELNTELQQLQTELEQAEQRQSASQQGQAAEQRRPQLEKELSAAQERVEQLRQEYLRVEKISELKNLISEPKTASATQFSPEDLRAQIATYQSEIKALNQEIEQGHEDLQRLAADQSCYLCQRPFADDHQHQQLVDQRQQQREESQQLLIEKEQQLAAAEQLLAPAREAAAAQQAAVQQEQQLATLEQQRIAPGASQEELKVQGQEAKRAVEKYQQELIAVEADRRQIDTDIEQEVSKLQESLQRRRQELSELPDPGSEQENRDYQQAEQLCQQLEQEITSLQALIPEVAAAVSRSQQQLNNSQQALAGREKELRALKDYQQQQETLDRLGTYLQGFQNQLVAEIRPALEEIGSEMLVTVSDGKYQKMIIDQDYEISVRSAQGTERRAAILSGGEQIRVNLCLRLALTRLVSQRTGVPVGFLILDEPLPSQDPGHVERILDLLASLKPFYQQQFIISHVGDIRNASELDYLIEFFPERQPRIELGQA
jgi:exonuclease SbcC